MKHDCKIATTLYRYVFIYLFCSYHSVDVKSYNFSMGITFLQDGLCNIKWDNGSDYANDLNKAVADAYSRVWEKLLWTPER